MGKLIFEAERDEIVNILEMMEYFLNTKVNLYTRYDRITHDAIIDGKKLLDIDRPKGKDTLLHVLECCDRFNELSIWR